MADDYARLARLCVVAIAAAMAVVFVTVAVLPPWDISAECGAMP